MTTEINENTEATGGNAEAAKYRRQLRDAEATRDDLQGQLDTWNREAIERRAAQHLAVASDLFDLGEVDPADLLGDDGRVDPDKVDAAARALIEARPGLAATAPVERLVEAWREHGNTGPEADRYAEKLRALAPYLDITAFQDAEGNMSADALEAFSKVTQSAFNWPDLGGGQRGNLDAATAASGWKGLVHGRK